MTRSPASFAYQIRRPMSSSLGRTGSSVPGSRSSSTICRISARPCTLLSRITTTRRARVGRAGRDQDPAHDPGTAGVRPDDAGRPRASAAPLHRPASRRRGGGRGAGRPGRPAPSKEVAPFSARMVPHQGTQPVTSVGGHFQGCFRQIGGIGSGSSVGVGSGEGSPVGRIRQEIVPLYGPSLESHGW